MEKVTDEFKIDIVEDYLSGKKEEIEKAENKVEAIQYHHCRSNHGKSKARQGKQSVTLRAP